MVTGVISKRREINNIKKVILKRNKEETEIKLMDLDKFIPKIKDKITVITDKDFVKNNSLPWLDINPKTKTITVIKEPSKLNTFKELFMNTLKYYNKIKTLGISKYKMPKCSNFVDSLSVTSENNNVSICN